jgi:ABC-type transport system involved in multi-copper enzyme maturation permease subunit
MKFDPLWPVQAAAVARLEVFRNLFALRAVPLYFLAGLPVFVVGVVLLVAGLTGQLPDELDTKGGIALFFAHLYEFVLRFVIYVGCVWIFMNLFRGEVLDRSLHYYFLAPIRREVLVAGKFVAGWLTASLLFCTTTVVTMFLLYASAGPLGAIRQFLGGPALGPLVGYLGVTLLACLGYGAVFLVMGLFFREPILPALLIFVWEQINPFLPAFLKKISVLFYLKSLLPVTLDDGVFAVIADPVPPWLAAPGLLLFTAVLLVIAGLRIRRMEIAYAND